MPKSDEQVKLEVARIDVRIGRIRASIERTDDEIRKLIELNVGRRKTLRELGQNRSEKLTFELL